MLRKGFFAVALLALSVGPAAAAPITVDEILSDSTTNAALLSGTIDMTLSGNTLTIILTNTSADAAGSGAGILLTGIGFQLPTGVAIVATWVGSAIRGGGIGKKPRSVPSRSHMQRGASGL